MRPIALMLAWAALCMGAAPRTLSLTLGRGELLQFAGDVLRVAVAEPKIADAIVVSPREVMINGKGIGKTTVVIWDSANQPQRYDVDILADTSEIDSLRHEFQTTFPDSGVNISGNHDTLVLTGNATDAEFSKRAQALASTRSKNVVNLLKVPAPPEPRQILLQVKFASVDRVGLSELGFNIFSRNPKLLGETSTEQFQQPRFSQLQPENAGMQNSSVNFADLLNIFLFRPDLNIGATIRALQGRNLLQILAEPNLICVEGKEASFLAGGEFPFPVLTSTTTGGAIAPVVTVQFKRFGIQLNFTPTITANGSIQLEVAPEVSSLDFANAVTLQGFLIPAISARRAETNVVLKDGESFAIAGLIDNRVEQVLNRVKGLGDVPILGQLFRSRSTRKSTDELLVVITPHFVHANAPGEKVKLPDPVETFLPTVEEEKAAKDAKKNKKKKDPAEFVGPRGHQEPQQ